MEYSDGTTTSDTEWPTVGVCCFDLDTAFQLLEEGPDSRYRLERVRYLQRRLLCEIERRLRRMQPKVY